jgi:catechol 2,3-dioxygenase-like lactoylglutathione lyase family enzyme
VSAYVPPTEQLVLELFVRDAAVSKAFYLALGFELLEDRGSFVVLGWEGHQLFLDERPQLGPPQVVARANVRVMVPDVDQYLARAQQLGAPIAAPIADREYGLRDFTLLDPDGFGVRFGTRLQSHH